MTTELLLSRAVKTDVSTIGELFIDGRKECFILEDTDRGLRDFFTQGLINQQKVKGKTAIPTGRYEIAITWSNRFKQQMPLLLGVPGFEGIRIHPGNTAADTEGCLLPGLSKGENTVFRSALAYASLLAKITAALKTGKVFITIE